MTDSTDLVILLVEDQAIIALDESMVLEKHGFSVITVHNGETAVSAVRENSDIDLVLMDIDLGSGIDGTETARRIISIRHIPIVFLTSHAEKEMVDKVRGITRYGYVLKNSGEFVLTESITMALELFNSHRKTLYKEKILEHAQELARLGNWHYDFENGEIYWSKDMYRIFDRDPSDGPPPKSRHSHLLHPDDVDHCSEIIKKAKEEGTGYTTNFRIITGDGETRYLVSKGTPEKDHHGNVTSIFGITQDITEQKKAEMALIQTGRYYENILDYVPVFVLDINYRYVHVNQLAADLVHMDIGALIGNDIREIFEGIEETDFFTTYKEVMETGISSSITGQFMHPDGSLGYYQVHVLPITEGIQCVCIDITSRILLEDQLVKSEKRFREFAELLPQIVFEADSKLNLTFVNRAGLETFGYTEDDFNSGLNAIEMLVPEDRSRASNRIRKRLSGEKLDVAEFRALKKDGSAFPVNVYVSILLHGDSVVGYNGLLVDITSLKSAERELVNLLSLKNAIQESIDNGILVVDMYGNILSTNERFIKMWNIPENLQHATNDRELLSYVVEQLTDPDWFIEKVNSIYSAPETIDNSTVNLNDGRVIQRYSQPMVIDGTPTGRVWSFMDITRFVRTEEALRESKYQLDLALHAAVMGIWDWEIETGKVDWAGEHAALFGIPIEDFGGTIDDVQSCVHPDDREMGMEVFRRTVEENVDFDNTYRIVWPDGTIHWMNSFGKLIRDEDDAPYRIVGITRDITVQKLSNDLLRESEEKYRRILEEIEDGYYEADLAGRMVFFNDSMCNLLGYSQSELKGMHYKKYTDKQNAGNIYQAFHRVYKTGKPERGFSWELITRTDESKYIEASVSLIRDRKGAPKGFRGIARDITHRKEAEEEIRNLLKEKEDLLGELQHRMKNSMQLMTSLVNMEYRNARDQETRDSLDTLHGQVRSLSNLYVLLHDTGSVTSINLHDYFRSIISSLRTSYSQTNRHVSFHEEYEPVNLGAKKATSLGLILNELLTNAIKHAFPGDAHGNIYITLKSEDGSLLLTVSDDGEKLPEGFSVETATGSGIQLVSMLTMQLKGTLSIEQEDIKVFRVFLPFE